jgi:BirA family biotin operon repressor/biotin-[acetyl-CoA-carboxylase] ligase
VAPAPLGVPPVLELLADGLWHSGKELGAALGLSRAAIWKQIRGLRALGLAVLAERRQGYCLAQPLDLLSAGVIRAALDPATDRALELLEVLRVTDSTNAFFTGRTAPPPGRLWAAVAEYQTGGRGRRGRRWLSPFGHGICLSVAWTFETAPRDLPALSLVAGIAVARAVESLGVVGLRLKWPNDVVVQAGTIAGKVGGILVEVAGEPGGPLRAVMGIGLNVRPVPGISEALLQEGGNPPAALDELCPGTTLERNALGASLLNSLHDSLLCFTGQGFEPFSAAWRGYDALAGRDVSVTQGTATFQGVARGIAADGALLVETGGRLVPVVAGDVTLRGRT